MYIGYRILKKISYPISTPVGGQASFGLDVGPDCSGPNNKSEDGGKMALDGPAARPEPSRLFCGPNAKGRDNDDDGSISIGPFKGSNGSNSKVSGGKE